MRTERPPTVLAERYALQTLLERTPAGSVWLATDTVLDRSVTVTLIDPDLVRDEATRARLLETARALATAPPSRIAELLDAGIDADVPFVVTERLSGRTLTDILEHDGTLPPRRAASIVTDVLDGLGEARSHGLPPPTVSTATIVLDEAGRVRIADVGISAAVRAAMPGGADRAVAGTGDAGASRLAEAVDGEPDEVATAGALLVELVTGARADAPIDADRVAAPRSIRAIVARSVPGGRGKRFEDPSAMAAALREVMRSHAEGEEEGPSGRPAIFRTWIAVPLLVALVVSGIIAAGVWIGRLQIGGGALIRIKDAPPATIAPSVGPLSIAGVSILDPYGDGIENDDDAPNAADGEPATVWASENYWDGTLNKPGLGLVLDLGRERTITGFRIDTPSPGFRFSVLVGDDPAAVVRDASDAAEYVAPGSARQLDAQRGRYVVVWIRSVVALPDGSHRAVVSDVRVLGSS